MFLLKSIFFRLYALYLSVNTKKIRLGRSVVISTDSKLDSNVAILDYCRIFSTMISSYSYVSPFSIIINTKIGKYTSIGPGCKIGLGVHPIDYVSTSPYFYNDDLFSKRNNSDFKPVNIGNDVWIGANALIMGGVNIGHGCVIGAGAVVTKDLEPYSIAVGVPAKVIRKRFSDEYIAKLLLINWWDKKHATLVKNKKAFSDLNFFIKGSE